MAPKPPARWKKGSKVYFHAMPCVILDVVYDTFNRMPFYTVAFLTGDVIKLPRSRLSLTPVHD